MGKGVGSGYSPVGGIAFRDSVAEAFYGGEGLEFSLGHTFGGNPLTCAAAIAAITEIVEKNLVENAKMMGEYLWKRLEEFDETGAIGEIRGKGLLIGIELEPEAGGARRFCEALKEEGLLCKETHEHVIRFAPPLIIKQKDLNWAFRRIQQVFKRI